MTHEELRAELQRIQSMTEPEVNALVERAIAVIRTHVLEEAAREVEAVAAIADHPSVYMGGASHRAKKMAKAFADAIRALTEESGND